MKKVLIGSLFLTSFSAFSATDCTYFAQEVGGEIENSLSRKAIRVVENRMDKQGFKRVFDVRDAAYTLSFQADWWSGGFNGLDHETLGDAAASIKLILNSNQRVKAEALQEGAGGAKDAKAILLLKRALKSVPRCSEI